VVCEQIENIAKMNMHVGPMVLALLCAASVTAVRSQIRDSAEVLEGGMAGEEWTRTELPDIRHGCGCGNPILHTREAATRKPRGTLFVNDKSKGISWLLALEANRSLAVDLPYAGGNHEGCIAPDGIHIAIPHYETAGPGSTEGGGAEGSKVSLLNLDTGTAEVALGAPSPYGNARPHDAAWTPSGRLLVTAQLSNAVTDFGTVLQRNSGAATGIKIPPPCETPHLLKNIPGSELVVSGCRCANPDTTSNCTAALAVISPSDGQARSIPIENAKWTEAITVTEDGDVWVGGLKSHNVFVFSFAGQKKTLSNLRLVKTLPNIPYPMRMAYEPVTNRVGVASLNLPDALERSKAWEENKPPSWDGKTAEKVNLRIFDASTYALQREMSLNTHERGLVNMEGLYAADGFFVAGGFDTAAMALVDAESGQVAAEVYFPPCSLPAGFCEPVYMSNWETAKANGQGGWNNWTGGYCPAHMRTPNDRRFMVMDGFGWSKHNPSWASVIEAI